MITKKICVDGALIIIVVLNTIEKYRGVNHDKLCNGIWK